MSKFILVDKPGGKNTILSLDDVSYIVEVEDDWSHIIMKTGDKLFSTMSPLQIYKLIQDETKRD